MLTNRTLARINNRPRKISRLPLLAVVGGTLSPGGAAVRVRGLALLRHPRRPRRWRSARPPALRDTEGEDDHLPLIQGQSRQRDFGPLLRGAGSPGGPCLIWEDLAPADSARLPKAGEVAPSPEREPARVGLLSTPGIKADVPVWGIEAGDESFFFFPEGALIYRMIATIPSLTSR